MNLTKQHYLTWKLIKFLKSIAWIKKKNNFAIQ